MVSVQAQGGYCLLYAKSVKTHSKHHSRSIRGLLGSKSVKGLPREMQGGRISPRNRPKKFVLSAWGVPGEWPVVQSTGCTFRGQRCSA